MTTTVFLLKINMNIPVHYTCTLTNTYNLKGPSTQIVSPKSVFYLLIVLLVKLSVEMKRFVALMPVLLVIVLVLMQVGHVFGEDRRLPRGPDGMQHGQQQRVKRLVYYDELRIADDEFGGGGGGGGGSSLPSTGGDGMQYPHSCIFFFRKRDFHFLKF